MRFLKSILCVLGLGSPAAKAQDPETGFGPAHALLAVQELSADDPAALQAAEAFLSDGGDAGSFAALIAESAPHMATIWYALDTSGRLAHLDWKADAAEALAWFERLFARQGIAWPEDTAPDIVARARQAELAAGDDVGYVYVALRPLVEAAGFEILNLDTGGDAYAFLLAPAPAGDRWRSVGTDPGMRIESPDWQFHTRPWAAGAGLRHTDHPARAPAAPPPVPVARD